MAAYSTRAPNTNRMQANIHASMAVSPEVRLMEWKEESREFVGNYQTNGVGGGLDRGICADGANLEIGNQCLPSVRE